jgi:phospholipase/carboxylesterase
MTAIQWIERAPRQATAAAAPLLVLLHGYGSNEQDLFGLADELDPRLRIVSLRAPLTLPWGGYAWYQLSGSPGRLVPDAAGRDAALDQVAALLAQLPERCGSDPRRTYLLGFSQGAILSLALAWQGRAVLAGVAAIAGRLDPATATATAAAALTTLPILQIHGRSDTVIALSDAHAARERLLPLAQAYHYHEHAQGHTIDMSSLQVLRSWLRDRIDTPSPVTG